MIVDALKNQLLQSQLIPTGLNKINLPKPKTPLIIQSLTMSLSLLRFVQRLSKSGSIKNNNNLNTILSQRLFCTNPPKEPPLSSSASSEPHETPSSVPPPKKNGFLTALKFGFTAAVTGVLSAAGYATYAYTLEEVDEKTKAFRDSANYPVEDEESVINKLQASVRYATVVGLSCRPRGWTRIVPGWVTSWEVLVLPSFGIKALKKKKKKKKRAQLYVSIWRESELDLVLSGSQDLEQKPTKSIPGISGICSDNQIEN